MRYLALCLVLFVLTGCFAEPATVQNPRTGEVVACSTAGDEWNPWSQADACVAGHITQGWTVAR